MELKINEFFHHGYIYRISVCFVFSSKVQVSIQNHTRTIIQSIELKINEFFHHGHIYRISVCFVFYSKVQVSIRNYTRTIIASIEHKINEFFTMVVYTGFLYVLYFQVKFRYQYETTPEL